MLIVSLPWIGVIIGAFCFLLYICVCVYICIIYIYTIPIYTDLKISKWIYTIFFLIENEIEWLQTVTNKAINVEIAKWL